MQPQVPEPVDHTRAQGGAVLADPRREDDRVEAAQLGEVCADVVPDAVGPDGETGLGERVTAGGSIKRAKRRMTSAKKQSAD